MLTFGTTYNSDDFLNRSFRGAIDEMRIYRRLLSSDEIEQLFTDSSRSLELTFDDPPGQLEFEDSSVNGLAGNCDDESVCPDSGILGRSNQSARFDGDDFLRLSSNAELLGLEDANFTAMAWVKLAPEGSGNRTILGTNSSSSRQGLQLMVDGNNRPFMGFSGGSELTASIIFEPDKRYHLAWRYHLNEPNENGGLDDVKQSAIFVNGINVGSLTGVEHFRGTGQVVVGRSANDNYFQGMIDHLVVVQTGSM